MNKFLKKGIIIIAVLAVFAGSFFYSLNQINYSQGTANNPTTIEIKKGEDVIEIGKKMEDKKLISNYAYFVVYFWVNGIHGKIIADKYEISPNLSIPEIAKVITSKKEIILNQVKITFPEGWSVKKMADRLNANNLPGDEFQSLVNDPTDELENEFDFLLDKPKEKSLEGYLFPDTYFFAVEASAKDIVAKLLSNFDKKISESLRNEIVSQEKSVYEILSMASVIENEVRSSEDRKIVSDIFWGRIKIGQPLQSCATLAYILGVNKKQYSFEDTRIDSPYNTYISKGLPPGPISNPGIVSIEAAIYPTLTDYNYFLSDPETGETVFSRTLDEHNANKVKHGL
ncbi:endolytic transglycosylase MltG [Patescibacteria group bacterium]